MTIDLKIKTNADLVKKRYSRIQKRFKGIIQKGILQAGFQLLDIIRTKTKKGINFNDRPFAPYSEGYLKHLNKIGYPTKVDLHYTGDMMGSLTPSSSIKKTGKHKISIGFARAEERDKALWNQVLGNPKREFFGFNNRTEKIISKQFNRFVEKELRKFKI